LPHDIPNFRLSVRGKRIMNEPDATRAMNELNTAVIAEFRANAGVVTEAMDGRLKDLDVVLLHHVGRRSGKRYVTPVSYMPYEGSLLVMGSYGGAPVEPRWVGNIEAMPELTVELGTQSYRVVPSVLREGPERARLYAVELERWPFVRDLESLTSRVFPVVRLTPVDRPDPLATGEGGLDPRS
jgi:deazaflavin-dependent oxidoreductase (nitroreductase family)